MKRKKISEIAILTDSEIEILMRGMHDPDLITEYFFRPKNGTGKGWRFDENFTERGKWQKAVHHAKQSDIFVIGGFGCLDVDAKIWTAEFGYIAIRDILRRGFTPTVLSKTPSGWALVKASKPYFKGVEPMFRVKTSAGRQVVGTANHRVLTKRGWQRIVDLLPGDVLIVPDKLPATVYDDVANARDANRIARGWPQHCCPDLRQDGVPAVSLSTDGLSSFSWSVEPGSGCVSVHVDGTDRLQNTDCKHLWVLHEAEREYRWHAANAALARPAPGDRALGQCEHSSNPGWKDILVAQPLDPGAMPSFFAWSDRIGWSYLSEKYAGTNKPCLFLDDEPRQIMSHADLRALVGELESTGYNQFLLSQVPPEHNRDWWNCTTVDHVWSIECVGDREVYDLHVPIYNNYVAEGMLHHNTGKTTGVAMSACVWALTTHPDFKFLNAAPTLKQAFYMYNFIMTNCRGTRFEDLIYSSPETPYPKIELRFYVKTTLVVSILEFMSVSENADSILGWEGDWINLDEAFLNDNLEEIVTIVGSRLRGTIQGRQRLGRMSMITNSHDNFYGWYLAELAASDPVNYLTMVISSRDNKNVTEEQLQRMMARIPPEERERFIDGMRPEGRGVYFSKERVYACEDPYWGEIIEKEFLHGSPGYELQRGSPGIVQFALPYEPANVYMLLGDPGTGDAPARNAPVLAVWDVTDFPVKSARLVAFWWGGGGGSITPFFGMLLRYLLKYKPIFTGIDSTGPQKNTAELLNIYFGSERVTNEEILSWLGPDIPLPEKGVRLPRDTKISGLDFSGPKKSSYLVAGRVFIEAQKISWPRFVAGIRSQLTNYDPAKDRSGETQKNKIAQDIVSVWCMSAFTFRVWFSYDPTEWQDDEDNQEDAFVDAKEVVLGVRAGRRSAGRDARTIAAR